eukprot:scaffold78674_cov35-Attheya_sp.AAC.1
MQYRLSYAWLPAVAMRSIVLKLQYAVGWNFHEESRCQIILARPVSYYDDVYSFLIPGKMQPQ